MLGPSWETVLGTAWQIVSSTYLQAVGTYQNTSCRVVGAFPPDQFAEVLTEVAAAPGDVASMGPAVRIDAYGSCYHVKFEAAQLAIYRLAAGVGDTFLASVVQAPTAGTFYKVRLIVAGSALEVFVNDVSKATVSDSTLGAGSPGCSGLTGETATLPRFESFRCTAAINQASGVVGALQQRVGE